MFTDVIKRIQEIIDANELNASTFAQKIGVQRATISHILSGRNKPSLDFVMKVTNTFKDVSLDWLVYGKKKTLDNKDLPSYNKVSPTLFDELDENKFEEKKPILVNTKDDDETEKKSVINHQKENSSLEIERIVIFYKNGSFKNYQN